MKHVILVDDDAYFVKECSSYINDTVEGLEVVNYFNHPAPKGDLPSGPLCTYLRNIAGDYAPDDQLLILLDMHFGNQDRNFRLGLKTVEAIKALPNAANFHIVMVTGTDNRIVYDKLVELGVRQIISKTHFPYNLTMGLEAAQEGKDYFVSYQPRAVEDLEAFNYYISVRWMAMGYGNRFVPRTSATAAGTNKRIYKQDALESLPLGEEKAGFRVPEEDEWNDVWLLLSLLKSRDHKIISYVEEVCGIRITVPI